MRIKFTSQGETFIASGNTTDDCFNQAAEYWFPGVTLAEWRMKCSGETASYRTDGSPLTRRYDPMWLLIGEDGESFGVIDSYEILPLPLSEAIAQLQQIYAEHGDNLPLIVQAESEEYYHAWGFHLVQDDTDNGICVDWG